MLARHVIRPARVETSRQLEHEDVAVRRRAISRTTPYRLGRACQDRRGAVRMPARRAASGFTSRRVDWSGSKGMRSGSSPAHHTRGHVPRLPPRVLVVACLGRHRALAHIARDEPEDGQVASLGRAHDGDEGRGREASCDLSDGIDVLASERQCGVAHLGARVGGHGHELEARALGDSLELLRVEDRVGFRGDRQGADAPHLGHELANELHQLLVRARRGHARHVGHVIPVARPDPCEEGVGTSRLKTTGRPRGR